MRKFHAIAVSVVCGVVACSSAGIMITRAQRPVGLVAGVSGQEADQPYIEPADSPPMRDISNVPLEVVREGRRASRLSEKPKTVVVYRGVSIVDVAYSSGQISFLVEGELFQRDDPTYYTWIARVLDRESNDVLFEMPFVEDSFYAAPGIFMYPYYLGWFPCDVDEGDYMLEVAVDSLSDRYDLTNVLGPSRREFSVE